MSYAQTRRSYLLLDGSTLMATRSQPNSDWGSAADPRLSREKSISVVVVVVVVVCRVEMFDDEELETEYR